MPRQRTAGPALTPRERREQVVAILSDALASMPPALAISHETALGDSPESSQKALEVFAKSRLSVRVG